MAKVPKSAVPLMSINKTASPKLTELDIVMTAPNNSTNNNGDGRLISILGNGNGAFQAPTSQLLAGGPVFITAAEFNGDNFTDVAVTRPIEGLFGDLVIFSNDGSFGDGAVFVQSQLIETNNLEVVTPTVLVSSDIEGDGDNDIFFAFLTRRQGIQFFDDDGVLALFNNGAGSFTANNQNFLIGKDANPIDMAVGDIDQDNKDDIVTANNVSSDTSFLLQSGFGGFQDVPAGTGTQGVALADFNGDGLLDIAAANNDANGNTGTITISLQSANVVFPAPANQFINTAVEGVRKLVASDIDQDGDQDLAISVAEQVAGSPNDVGFLFNNGDGTFAPILFVSAGSSVVDVAVADFDGDSISDLATVNAASNDVSILIANP